MMSRSPNRGRADRRCACRDTAGKQLALAARSWPDLIPALGATHLELLTHYQLAGFIRDQLAAGRGPITLRRCIATLSSALNDVVRQRRLPHNPPGSR